MDNLPSLAAWPRQGCQLSLLITRPRCQGIARLRYISDRTRSFTCIGSFSDHPGSNVQSDRLAWGDDLTKLSRKLSDGLLRSVFRHDHPRFGPFYDAARPLGQLEAVSRRRIGYATNATLDRAAFLAAFGEDRFGAAPRSRSATDDYYFYSGALAEALGQEAEYDLDPGLDELLRLNPAQSSINLWIGQPEVTTPCHYDGYHNLYVQLHGTKRFLLLPPTADQAMQTFPFLHPSYGQCQRDPL